MAVVIGVSATIGAIVMLRRGWQSRGDRPGVTAIGWSLLAVGTLCLSWSLGAVQGVVAAALLFSLGGLAAVFVGMERRPERHQIDKVAEPEKRSGRRWRGRARGMAAFLLAMFSAVAVGAAFAGLPVGAPFDRVSIGSYIVPFLWAGFVIWTLSDPKLLRPVLGMSGALVLAGGAIAWRMMA